MPSPPHPLLEPHSDVTNSAGNRRSGWIAGVLGGVILVLLVFPSSRYTLLAQLQFALAERSLPFLHALSVRANNREIALLNRVAAGSPDDYLMQVGRATVLAAEGGLQPRQRLDSHKTSSDNTLYRLGAVVERFPQAPGAYAHLCRYMMKDRIRLERSEVPEFGSNQSVEASEHNLLIHPSGDTRTHSDAQRLNVGQNPLHFDEPDPDDLRMMEWALRAGERRDPTNAFWPAMLATTYFVAKRDTDGAEALRRSSLKVRWDAYLYEEILGEWRLYSAAYGDNGGIQKIGPLSLVSFPHLGEIRNMAQFVRYLAERAERDGNDALAINLRRELMLLGTVMRSKAQWAYEALIGTDVCLIAATDSRSTIMPGRIRSVPVWQAQAPKYIALLKRNNRTPDVVWLRAEINNCCQLRNRIDLARYDASYPGIPPGIPLTPLFGSWMAGVCLIQEILTLLAVLTFVRGLDTLRSRSRTSPALNRTRTSVLTILGIAWVCSAFMAASGVPSTRYMLLLLVLSALNLIIILDAIKTARLARYANSSPTPTGMGLRQSVEPIDSTRKWNYLTTTIVAALAICPSLIGIELLWPLLSTQHPVAAALTSLVDVSHYLTFSEALQVSLFGTMATLTALIGLSIFALARKQLILPQVCIGLTRLAAPIVVFLTLAYVVTLNRTILLDVNASRAISDAARNDLQWVLTHSDDSVRQ